MEVARIPCSIIHVAISALWPLILLLLRWTCKSILLELVTALVIVKLVVKSSWVSIAPPTISVWRCIVTILLLERVSELELVLLTLRLRSLLLICKTVVHLETIIRSRSIWRFERIYEWVSIALVLSRRLSKAVLLHRLRILELEQGLVLILLEWIVKLVSTSWIKLSVCLLSWHYHLKLTHTSSRSLKSWWGTGVGRFNFHSTIIIGILGITEAWRWGSCRSRNRCNLERIIWLSPKWRLSCCSSICWRLNKEGIVLWGCHILSRLCTTWWSWRRACLWFYHERIWRSRSGCRRFKEGIWGCSGSWGKERIDFRNRLLADYWRCCLRSLRLLLICDTILDFSRFWLSTKVNLKLWQDWCFNFFVLLFFLFFHNYSRFIFWLDCWSNRLKFFGIFWNSFRGFWA